MRTMSKEEFIDLYLEYELGLYGLTENEQSMYYQMYIFGRLSVRS